MSTHNWLSSIMVLAQDGAAVSRQRSVGAGVGEKYGMSRPSFYRYRRPLAARDEAVVRFVLVQVTPQPLTGEGSGGAVDLVLGAGRRLGIGPGFDGPTLDAPAGAAGKGPAKVLSLPTSVRIWLATKAKEFHKWFDALAEMVRQ